jgi:hypothetical protein
MSEYTRHPDLIDKRIVGDAMVTRYDVSKVTCANACLSRFPCNFFFHQKASRQCVFCASFCIQFTLVPDPGWHGYNALSGQEGQYRTLKTFKLVSTQTGFFHLHG